ncbi:hypothetical protein H3Z85_08490 [Chryseobacterium indologenes]|uniref:hypothetical protein n=1 Tax=Chryseobacterium indologenes TaxID=253 RepID=UPI0004AED97E|nr:hypothetical protein [Chryseobacterium indologenes]QPQ53357.1 hypothetical protein H3Z85_08490 [Chryseobacterium indologenes]SFJ61512.1 hypothetical protein SAMN05421692_2138 [Chryseobacterium indologenes]SUX52197.1 Uncharacterised protein [Chryseobacterium indologenes]
MKKLIISSLAMVMTVGCVSSNDNSSDNNNNNDNTPYLLKKVTETTQDGQVYTLEFKYNGDKILESYSATDNEKTVYTYNGDNIVKTEEYEGATMRQMREFTYSNGKVLSEKVTRKDNGTLIYTKNYQYLSDTHIKFNEYKGSTYSPSTGTHSNIQFAEVDAYLTNSGNIASTSYTFNGTTYNVANTYDNSNHPMKNVKGYIKIDLFYLGDGELAYNNLISRSENYTGSVSGYNKTNADHTFNSAAYPTKTLMKYTSSSFGTNTHTYVYEYNK